MAVPDLSTLTAFVVALLAAAAAARSLQLGVDHVSARRVHSRAAALADRPPTSGRWSSMLARLRRMFADRTVDEVWPAWLDAAVRSARSGASLRDSLVEAASAFRATAISPQLESFTTALDGGASLSESVECLAGVGAPTGNEVVVRALHLAVRTGGPAVVVLDAVASTLHERAALSREIRALATQARASAAVMIVAPVVFLALSGSADGRVMAFFTTLPGLVCLVAGLTLDGLGAMWMVRIVRAEP